MLFTEESLSTLEESGRYNPEHHWSFCIYAKVILVYRLNNNSFPQTIIFGCHGDST